MNPVPRDRLLQQAQALRGQGQVAQALAVLGRLQAAHPRFGRAWQEEGRCHVQRRAAEPARAALRRAVALNPMLPSSWDMLAQLHRMAGDAAAAAEATRALARLHALPPAVVMAGSLHADGDLAPAEALLRDHLATDAGNAGALRLLARLRAEQGDLDEALDLLATVLAEAPDFAEARQDRATLLLQAQRPAEARAEAEKLVAAAPDHRASRQLLAAACIAAGDMPGVIVQHGRLLADGAASPAEAAELSQWLGHALKTCGEPEAAIRAYRAALAAREDHAVAWFGLANLKTWRCTDADLARMTALAARPDLAPMDRIYLAFALGKAHEDRGDDAGAWQHYARGNALRHAVSRYRPEVVGEVQARLAATFTPAMLADAGPAPVTTGPVPIFVVGLPRAGSTLVEQILASHPLVEGTRELAAIGRLCGAITGRDPTCGLPAAPDALATLTPAQWQALGQRYCDETAHERRLGRPFFVDKMPDNAWYIGFIRKALPQARIVAVHRAPLACGVSNFRQLFGGANNEWSYDLADMGRHMRALDAMLAHWDAVLPGQVLTLSHEALVGDLEGGVRRLLDHCGLPFDPACLRFFENRRPVQTPSAEQVRRPIDPATTDQWRRFAPWLGPLRVALGLDETA